MVDLTGPRRIREAAPAAPRVGSAVTCVGCNPAFGHPAAQKDFQGRPSFSSGRGGIDRRRLEVPQVLQGMTVEQRPDAIPCGAAIIGNEVFAGAVSIEVGANRPVQPVGRAEPSLTLYPIFEEPLNGDGEALRLGALEVEPRREGAGPLGGAGETRHEHQRFDGNQDPEDPATRLHVALFQSTEGRLEALGGALSFFPFGRRTRRARCTAFSPKRSRRMSAAAARRWAFSSRGSGKRGTCPEPAGSRELTPTPSRRTPFPLSRIL